MKPVLVLRHVPHESLGLIEDILTRAGLPFRFEDMFRDVPRAFRPDDWAGLVVLGGPMNVDQTDAYPFLAAEVGWIRDAMKRDLPLLGVCLGSQLLAKALGARVYPNPVKEIGWYELELLPAARDDRLLAGARLRERVFQWHGDTFDLPAGAVHLARSPLCENQAFRHGPAAWGFQFHLEVTSAMVEEWLAEPGNHCELAALDYVDPVRIRARTAEELPAVQALGEGVFGRFATLCRERS